MRGRIYLLALVLAVLGAIYNVSHGNTVGAVLFVFPGYFLIAYVLILISTFLPGKEKSRYEAARAEAFPEYYPTPAPPPSMPMHPAFMGGISETVYSGHGILGLLESGDLLFGSATLPPETHQYPPTAFRGFKVESAPEWVTGGPSPMDPSRPVVMLDGGSAAMMVRLWVQPDEIDPFVDHLESVGIARLD